MTQTERDAIRVRHADLNGLCAWCCCSWPCDAIALLAEVDRLTALVNDEALLVMRGHSMVRLAEQNRILAAVEAAVEALPVFESEYGNDLLVPLDDVIAAIEGETT